MGEAYGTVRGADERFPEFPKRISFLIDPQGNVAKVYEVTDVAGHPAEVLADIRAAA